MAVYVKNPKCPKCGAELDFDTTIDLDYDDEWLCLKCVGWCSVCNTNYRWTTNYPLGTPNHSDLREC